MPESSTKFEKAYLQPLYWNESGGIQSTGNKIYVQFNPETLKVNFSNQIGGEDNNGGSAIQFKSRGTTKLTFELWFDVNGPFVGETKKYKDVRKYTDDLLIFLDQVTEGSGDPKPPPGCRFHWGTFVFDGIVDSINENLEFFSEDGVPLRASYSLGISRQEMQVRPKDQNAKSNANQNTPGGGAPGTEPQTQPKSDDNLSKVAGQKGNPQNWQAAALLNNIEDPLRLSASVSMPTASLSAKFSAGVTAKAQANFGVKIDTKANFKFGAKF